MAVNYAGDAIATLVDNNVSNLNVSGIGGITIGATAFTNAATSMTINNTDTNAAGLVLSMTDNSLGTLNVTGTGKTTLTLTDTVAGTIAITNSGTGSLTVSDGAGTAAANLLLTGAMTATFTDANVTSLSLAANQTVTFTDAGTSGITISGASDNNRVALTLGAAAATNTNTVTLGNANNSIADVTSAGGVAITVGTGSNLIDVHSAAVGNATYSAAITLGAHTATTGIDSILVSKIGTNTGTNTVITGAVTGDKITFTDTAGTVATVNLNANTYASVALGLTAAHGATAAHGVATFLFGGNTYVVQDVTAANAAPTSSVIELIGTHTVSSVTAGVITLLT